jgi:hypothetical protein
MKTISAQSDVAVLTSDQSSKVVEDYEQPRFSRRETLLTMLGVLMVMLLASLDQTIPLMAVPFFYGASKGGRRTAYTWEVVIGCLE